MTKGSPVHEGLRSGANAPPSLSRLTALAVGWQSVSSGVQFVLTFGVSVLLARLLTPVEFGVVAYAMVFVGLSDMLSEAGLIPALVQKKDLTTRDTRVGITLSLTLGLLAVLVLWAVAPLMPARVSRDTTDVLRIIALTFVARGPGLVSEALLKRRMDFARLFVADLASYLCGYAPVAIGLALSGYGVWSLVYGLLVQSIVRSFLLYLLAPYSMVPLLARTELGALTRFGAGMTLTRLAAYAASNTSLFLIGQNLGGMALGLYKRASSTVLEPVWSLTGVMTSVAFPALAKIQHDMRKTQTVYLAALSLVSLTVSPLLASVAVAAPQIILLVYGRQWTKCSLTLSILSVNALFVSVYTLADALAKAHARVYQQFCRYAIYAVIVCALVLTGARHSIEWVAAAVTIASAVMCVMMSHLAIRLLGMSWRSYLRVQYPGWLAAALVAAGMTATGAVARRMNVDSAAVILAAKLFGGCLGWGIVFLLPPRWLGDGPDTLLRYLRRIDRFQPLCRTAVMRFLAARYAVAGAPESRGFTGTAG